MIVKLHKIAALAQD